MFQLRFELNNGRILADEQISSRERAQRQFDSYRGSESNTFVCVELWQTVGGCSRCLDCYYFVAYTCMNATDAGLVLDQLEAHAASE